MVAHLVLVRRNLVRKLLKTPAIVIAIVVVGAGLLLGGLFVYVTDFSYKRQPFAAEAWRAGDAKLRGTMVPDLLDKHILIGHSRAEVTALLGPPDFTKDPYFHGAYYITYQVYMGKKLGFRPWPHFLHCVLAAPDGPVEKVYVAD